MMICSSIMEEELWFTIIALLCIAALVKASIDVLLPLICNKSCKGKEPISQVPLPPEGPSSSSPLIQTLQIHIPIIRGFHWLGKSTIEVEAALRSIRTNCGNNPAAITVPLTSRPAIFVFSRTLAHRALVQSGSLFADRGKPIATARILSSNQHNITSAGYGETWQILRRNLTSQILHPSRLQSFSQARSWVLGILINRLSTVNNTNTDSRSRGGGVVKVIDHFRYAMFSLLILMCFGDKLEEDEIRKIEFAQLNLLHSFQRFQLLNLRPTWLTKFIFRSRWKEFFRLKKSQDDVIIPLIRNSRTRRARDRNNNHSSVLSYIDSLLDLEVPEDGEDDNNNSHIRSKENSSTKKQRRRKLTEMEMVSACTEFLNAGTDTTTTALEWIMANLVKYPHIQANLYHDIKRVVSNDYDEQHQQEEADEFTINEEDLCKMFYLKSVVLEGLRRHPPAHFVLPHAVTHDAELDGFLFPKNSVINFMVAEMGWDPHVWEDPMHFKPERFLPSFLSSSSDGAGSGFDITGTRDIKMIPFGAGRRICPAFNLAILHLEYFVANLVWKFEWRSAEGDDIDLAEKQEFTVVMKHPLHAHIVPRIS